MSTVLINPTATIDQVLELIKQTAIQEQNSEAVNRLLEHVPFTQPVVFWLEKVFNHIKARTIYKEDAEGREQIKKPTRFLLKDGCGDCDDYATLWGAILNHVKIPFYFKIVRYNPDKGWAHIYVVVPTSTGYITLDNVLGTFNKEVKFIESKLYGNR